MLSFLLLSFLLSMFFVLIVYDYRFLGLFTSTIDTIPLCNVLSVKLFSPNHTQHQGVNLWFTEKEIIQNCTIIMELRIASLNVRGLRDNTKRREVFNWLRKKNFQIYMLQETHCTENTNDLWRTEWGYQRRIFQVSHDT